MLPNWLKRLSKVEKVADTQSFLHDGQHVRLVISRNSEMCRFVFKNTSNVQLLRAEHLDLFVAAVLRHQSCTAAPRDGRITSRCRFVIFVIVTMRSSSADANILYKQI